jgi:hypothetical protein
MPMPRGQLSASWAALELPNSIRLRRAASSDSRLYPQQWQSVYEELVRLGLSSRDAEDMLDKVTRPEDALAMFMDIAEEDPSW